MNIFLLDHTYPAFGDATAWANEFKNKNLAFEVKDSMLPNAVPMIPPPTMDSAEGVKSVVFLHSNAETRDCWIEKYRNQFPNVTGIENASALLILITAGGNPESELPEWSGLHGIYRLNWNAAQFGNDSECAIDFIRQIKTFACV